MTVINFNLVPLLQDEMTRVWHRDSPHIIEHHDDILVLILTQHLANFELWHLEDEARMAVDLAEVGRVKREIDKTNQRRNDLVAQVDDALYNELTQNPEASMHSETPGMMIDRLSILSLKIYHMNEQTLRNDVSLEHKHRCAQQAGILRQQRKDLLTCLNALWMMLMSGERRFKLYHQMKMYNDPSYGVTK